MAGGYLVCGLLWILLSDSLLSLAIDDPLRLSFWQSIKGWLFVAVTALALYLVLRGRFRSFSEWRGDADEGVLSYQLLFRQHPVPMWVHDQATRRFLAINDAAVSAWGYTRRELLSMTVDQVCVTRQPPAADAACTQLRYRDGSLHDVEVTAGEVLFEGRAAQLVLAKDVTVQRDIERALRISDERFRAIQKATNDAVWDWDIEAQTLWWSDAVSAMFGYPRDQVGGRYEWWAERIHPDDREATLATSDALLRGERESWQGEYRFRRADGSYADVLDRGFALRDDAGRTVRVIGALMDISERKRIERELRDSQERLDLALAASDLASWDWNLRSGKLTLSPHFGHMLGYASGQVGDDIKDWVALIEPEDLPRIRSQLVRHLKGESLTFEAEYRMRTSGGEWRWMSTVGRIVEQGGDGRALRMSGTHRDITVLKRTTDLVRKLSLAVDQSANMVVITDPAGVIEYVNPKFCEVTGYVREEIVGRELWAMKSLDMPVATFREIWETLSAGKEWHGELHNRKRSGEFYWCLESISPVRDEHGNISNFVSVSEDISERKHAESTIRHLAYYDPLTGLPNRRLFRDRLEQAKASAQRSGALFGLMYLDLDRFKQVNDTLGHEVGDLLLKGAAQRISDCLRKGDTMARLGGDEFAVIVSEVLQQEHLTTVADKIVAAMQKPFVLNGFELFTSTSVGISVFPSDSGEIEALIRNADVALYRAKELGRNNFQFFLPDMNERSMERLVIESKLRHALARDELFLCYLPQIDLASGRVTGVEALLRWRSPDLGVLRPADFVPLAEETGLIVTIGEWVLKTACRQFRSWRDAGLPIGRLSVNLSPRQFRQAGLDLQVEAALRAAALAPDCLEVEITEDTAMGNPRLTQGILDRLQAIGVGIVIDDFGSGYSSLATLKNFPVTRLKVDRTFVSDIPDSADDTAIVLAVIRMAHSLKLSVVAEGVESEAQLGFLRANGCDEAQGFLFSEPLPADELRQWLTGVARGDALAIVTRPG